MPESNDSHYEAEILRNPFGLYNGTVYLVDGGNRTKIGSAGGPLSPAFASRKSVVEAAKNVAIAHRRGIDIVRLDLD